MPSVYRILTVALLAVVVYLPAGSASAQTNFAGGLHFNAGFPQGEFKDQIDRNAYGIGAQLFFSPKKSPLALGLEFGWMNYGNKSFNEVLLPSVPDVTVKVTTSNNIVQGFFILRGQMPTGPIRLYADGLVGFNYLFTETKISDEDDPSDKIASATNQDDAALAYGIGGGVQVPIYARPVAKGKPIEILLDGGLRYVFGSKAEYLKKDSIDREDGQVTYDVIESKTNMLRLYIGVMVRF